MMAMQKRTHECSLSVLLAPWLTLPAAIDCQLAGISQDSRKVKPGDVFLACKGQTVDGSVFIDQAIEQGARAIIWQPDNTAGAITFSSRKTAQGYEVPLIAFNDLAENAGLIAARFYAYPSSQLFVIGITGTNGKTSCSHFLAQVLNENQVTGILGTLGNGLYGQLEAATHTTPDAVSCQDLLADMRDAGAINVAMEVSSHALDQFRVAGVEFDCAVFTNLTRDHLDYHGDMVHYLESKEKLFTMPSLRFAVLNADDDASKSIQQVIAPDVEILRYGMNCHEFKPEVYADEIVLDSSGMRMMVHTPWGSGELRTQLVGKFNISNLLAVLCVLLLKDIDFDTAIKRLSTIRGADGRMQCLSVEGKPLVVIDYAHTPDALQQALESLRQHVSGKLWCVFGCGGDRDKGKRAQMGAIAGQFADEVVITTDNPRSESPHAISQQINEGISQHEKVTIELDRAQAIELSILQASSNDIVLIAGKGHETYQEVNGKRYPFNDVLIAQQFLEVSA